MDALSFLSAFLMQVGMRHVPFDMTDGQRKLVQHPLAKGAVLFSMFYITTRSLMVAVGFTAVYFVLITVLLNETNPYNVISRSWLVENGFLKREFFDEPLVSTYKRNIENLMFAD